jgi:hypothetical protein
MFLNIPFPDFKKEISEEYKMVVADHNSLRKQKKYARRIMLFFHYLLCFWFSYKMFSFPSIFVKALFGFLVCLVATFLIVFLIHNLLHCLFYPSNTWRKNCYIGFYKLIPYCYCKKELNKFRLILAAFFPFVMLTVIPLTLISGVDVADILLFSVAYGNAILSAFDFYDIYVLIRKVPGWEKPVLKSRNRYFTVLKKEIKEPQDIQDALA